MVQIAAAALGREMKSNNGAPGYSPYHPRWYRPRVSTYWWLHQWSYLKFVLRELSSIFVALFVVITLLQLRALSHGAQAYADFQKWMKNPAVIALNAVSFVFVLFHLHSILPDGVVCDTPSRAVSPVALVPRQSHWLVLALACEAVLIDWDDGQTTCLRPFHRRFRWGGSSPRRTSALWHWSLIRLRESICSCCARFRCFTGRTGFATRSTTACKSNI